ncbi:unnamed protein product [Vicia faba]|uniref:Uncharacterized protein n=1 Tax=Vicia faba TaxID=3906 RepID=A0AAV0ZSD5_VICFA|nr:unnamed protein product [Vicia faba]
MEACKGFLGPDGDWPSSAKAEGSLTARPTRRAGTKVGLSDQTVPSLAPRFRLFATWSCSRFQGLGCSPIKAVRELGSERRETVRSISGVGVRALRGPFPSTRGPGRTHLWCASYCANGKRWVAKCGTFSSRNRKRNENIEIRSLVQLTYRSNTGGFSSLMNMKRKPDISGSASDAEQ